MQTQSENLRRTSLAVLYFCAVLLAFPLFGKEMAPRHSLWKIQGQHNTVHLFASIHVLHKDVYPLADPIEDAFRNAKIVVFETDLGQVAHPALQKLLEDGGRLSPGTTLPRVLPPELYAKFNQEVQEVGLPGHIFDNTKPSIAAITIEIFALKKLGFDPEFGVDRYFYDRARNQKKTIQTLEPVDFQIRLITGLSPKEGAALMKTTLQDIDFMSQLFGDLLKAWQTGDLEKLEKLLNHAMRGEPSLYQRMVTDRNRDWVPKVQNLLRGNQNAFVVVGAGHLVGNTSLVELLRKTGLEVNQE